LNPLPARATGAIFFIGNYSLPGTHYQCGPAFVCRAPAHSIVDDGGSRRLLGELQRVAQANAHTLTHFRFPSCTALCSMNVRRVAALSADLRGEMRTIGDTGSRANQRSIVLRCGGLPGHSISAPVSHETSSTGLFIDALTFLCVLRARRDAIENELIDLALNPPDRCRKSPRAGETLSAACRDRLSSC
jgi:hypothetical protein